MKTWIKPNQSDTQQPSIEDLVALFNQLLEPEKPNSGPFDTDSKPIGNDNQCSACIAHWIKDFIDTQGPADSPSVALWDQRSTTFNKEPFFGSGRMMMGEFMTIQSLTPTMCHRQD